MQEIRDRLFELQDLDYKDFHSRLMPTIDKDLIIGVRTPALKKLAKDLFREDAEKVRLFMNNLPHKYYEENNLHGAFIGLMAKTTAEALDLINEFLPYVDNWATCDSLPPKILSKDLNAVRSRIMPWIDSDETYRVRFAIVTLLGYFLDEAFEKEDLGVLAKIESEEYYINMAIAWYYSFALIKQYDKTIGLFEKNVLSKWVHNKSIQKAIESYRVAPEIKDYLRSLRRR
ncbi:MAG: DNA alkylation repair protein [Firmicutes bacterium]|nr:DNA alkylation repair protein [Bacillota bacterium]